MTATVAVAYLDALKDALSRNSLALDMLLDRCSLLPNSLDDADQRIAFTDYISLWNEACSMSGDPLFGLKVGADFHPGYMGDLSSVLMTAPDLERAILHLTRYEHVLQDGAETRLGFDKTSCYIEFNCELFKPEELRTVVEKDVAESLALAEFIVREARHNKELSASAVWFRHAPAGDIEDYRVILRCEEILFNQPNTRIIFDKDLLALDTHFGNASLFESVLKEFEQHADKGLVAQVKRYLSEQLQKGVPEIKQVADVFGMSHRTFQRRLSEEATSYKDLVTQVRQELAEQLLGRGNQSISEIAYLVGFTEASTFHQAFRRWTGQSPGEYRKYHQDND